MLAGKAKVFKLRCMVCGAEHVVEASKPGYALLTCHSCGTTHLLLLDHDLNLRDSRPIEAVEALPAGLHELDPDDPMLPTTLRELLAKRSIGTAEPEETQLALRMLKRILGGAP